MESLSRSSHRRKPSTTSANVFPSSFSFKNPYRDVLLSNGGERKSLQLHEYSEIFAGSSSIPVLDLPCLDERIGSGDVRSSKLDYTNIFGGLTHAEVFVPYEELLKKAKTRTSAESLPYLKESGSRNASRKTESPHGAASDHSVDGFKLRESCSLPRTINSERPCTLAFDGGKLLESGSLLPSRKMGSPFGVTSNLSFDEVDQQHSMSFNRTNQKNSDASDAKTHTAKLHAVPGFTHFVDESRPHKGKNDRPPLLKREVSRSWSFSAEVEPAKNKGGSSFEKSRVLDNSHNVNENNIKSQSSNTPMPSSYPSNPRNMKEPRQSKAFDFASKMDVSQIIAGESSEEFENNSVDAASASALKKAVEQAQESIRIAKLIMEKKRDCYQDGSKPRPISSLRGADRETQSEAFALNENSTRKKYEELGTVLPVLARTEKKLTPSLSHNDIFIHAEYSAGGSVWKSAETDREYGETFVGGNKLFSLNQIQSKTTHVDENITVQLEKNVEAAEEQREEKTFPGFGSTDFEPAKVGSINSLLLSTKELASNLGRLETSKETIECRNVTTNYTKGSEVPELIEEPVITPQSTHAGMEKSLEDDKLCRTTFDHVEGLENKEVRVLNSSQKSYEHNKIVDEASETLRIRQQDVVTEQRENDMNDKEQHEEKLEECEAVINTSYNLVENVGLEQEETEKKTQGYVHRCAKTDDEEINGTRQTESHFYETKEQLKEHMLEAINDAKLDALPEVGEFETKVNEAHEPKINNGKHNFADNVDDLKLPGELLQNQVEEERVNTSNSKYEASRTITMEAVHCANFRKTETLSEDEKRDNTLRGEDYYYDHFQEAAHGEDIDEPVNFSSNTDCINVDHTEETNNKISGTPESCHVESNSKDEDQRSVKNYEQNVPKSKVAVSAIDKDKMAEQLSNLQDDEMLRTDYMHRSASEDIFVENKLRGLRSHSRTEPIGFLDADPEENLSEDKDASNTAIDIHAAAEEYATEIDRVDIPEVLCSHIKIVDVEPVLEQTAESDEGSLSTSSFEKIDELSGQESEVFTENAKDTTSSKEVLRDEQKCAEEQTEGLESQLHDKPNEMYKPLESEEAVDMENEKPDLAGTSPVEERDAKEGVQNFESNDQQQRIEAIKRGREREKDRIAVERAIREARERAFAEVRERAAVERAATDVRQRIVEKPPVDKTSTEANLRAGRSAVERATTEARERALQKARSHKNSEDERFSTSSRNNVLKHSFSSSDLETVMNNESAQRRKARLERHQRIMERAEKALAEKNMRDLLVQKEQTERNRLAESLDADIKRWATGKEGNLRALLSTLQYILGPDSGWQSISLTEIITTPAVKKAYRKATLSVHPDKLQQRGATIQQKYICEKVFDLLKAAWTRFNSDER